MIAARDKYWKHVHSTIQKSLGKSRSFTPPPTLVSSFLVFLAWCEVWQGQGGVPSVVCKWLSFTQSRSPTGRSNKALLPFRPLPSVGSVPSFPELPPPYSIQHGSGQEFQVNPSLIIVWVNMTLFVQSFGIIENQGMPLRNVKCQSKQPWKFFGKNSKPLILSI